MYGLVVEECKECKYGMTTRIERRTTNVKEMEKRKKSCQAELFRTSNTYFSSIWAMCVLLFEIILGKSFSFPYQLQVLTASMLYLGTIDYGHPYVDLNSVVRWDYQSQIRKGKEELEIE